MTVVTVKYKITVWKKQDWSLWDFTEQNKKIDLKKWIKYLMSQNQCKACLECVKRVKIAGQEKNAIFLNNCYECMLSVAAAI